MRKVTIVAAGVKLFLLAQTYSHANGFKLPVSADSLL